jgi:hypothetical protein
MWVNHAWPLWISSRGPDGSSARPEAFASPDGSLDDIRRSMGTIISRYFHLPNYWRLNGRPLLVVWSASSMEARHGAPAVRALLDDLRAYARSLGHDGIHFHASQGSLRHSTRTPYGEFGPVEALGFDSYGLYNPVVMGTWGRPPEEEVLDYPAIVADILQRVLPEIDAQSPLPFFPAASPGWDTTPRCPRPAHRPVGDRRQWPGSDIVAGETPAAFSALVKGCVEHLKAHPETPPVLLLGCWNEWTEGHYLLPDTRFGYGMLQALAQALGRGSRTAAVTDSIMAPVAAHP